MDYATWIRRNGFILGLILAVVLAFVFPGPGTRNGFLHPDLINDLGIALILFLPGLSLAFENLKNGARNWKLHVIIQIQDGD
jgi:sodium/bile acid cotransporter 7